MEQDFKAFPFCKAKFIVLTGGPCAGKSTALAHMREHLQAHGYYVITPPEVATELITAGLSPNPADWDDPLGFQRLVLGLTIEREHVYLSATSCLKTSKPIVVIYDRGACDGEAYAGKEGFAQIAGTFGFTVHGLRSRYDQVIHLVTAAEGAEEFYTCDNNAARTETPEQARALDALTLAAWRGQRLAVIDNSTDFAGKIRRAVGALARTLNMPEPLENERSFVVRQFDPASIPADSVPLGIIQNYLVSTGDSVRRVRLTYTDDGVPTYSYAEKVATDVPGKRIERQRDITAMEYRRFMGERDPKARTIRKTRHCFIHSGRQFELDVFDEPVCLCRLEVELPSMDTPVELPPWWDLHEVTNDDRYSNYSIALGKMPREIAA